VPASVPAYVAKNVCASCGKPMKPNARFCNGCGTAVAAAALAAQSAPAVKPSAPSTPVVKPSAPFARVASPASAAASSVSAQATVMNYGRNAKYFKKFDFWVLGYGCVWWPLFIITIPYVLLKALYALYIKLTKPTDRQMDEQAESFMVALADDMPLLRKLGLEAEEVQIAAPLQLWGYEFENYIQDEANLKASDVQGSDGTWRSSVVTVRKFFFSEHAIHCYLRTCSLVSDNFNESTEEFFYKDIVSVRTESGERPIINRKTKKEDKKSKKNNIKIKYNLFALRTTGGEVTSCVARDNATADVAVNAMRSLLKQKKFS